MIRLLFLMVCAFVGWPAAAQGPLPVILEADPFERCQTVKEATKEGLSSHKCEADHWPVHATWFVTFDLDIVPTAYNYFSIRGGQKIETVSQSYPELSVCRRFRCTYYSTASLILPFDVLFSDAALRSGLTIKASGGPGDRYLHIEAGRIAAFRAGLIAHQFIQD
jgi:hypothetical protein